MDRCEYCGRDLCRDCGHHYCCEPCQCDRSHNCACECDNHDLRSTYAD